VIRSRHRITSRAARGGKRNLYEEAWQAGPGLLVRRAVKLAPGGGLAADLGCGVGQDAIHMARNGFRVLAVDHNRGAIDFLAANRVPGVTCRCIDLRDLRLRGGYYDLVHAARSLPFVGADHLDETLARITSALRPGGVVACHLFGRRGPRWRRGDEPGVASVTADGAVELLGRGLEILHLAIVELRATPASSPDEVFEIVARRPGR
jgi:SAM-dependent methyltransferase